jgi:hypothetical protein
MARTLRQRIALLDDRTIDLVGGTWLVGLMLGLLHLPALVP